MIRVVAATVAVGLASAGSGAGCARAAKPTAQQIVAKNVAARGGLDAWRKVATMVWIGRIESAHAPVPSMPFTLEQKRPNRTRLQIDALGERSLRVFDGVRGWKAPPGRGRPEVQPYSPQELKFAQAGHGIDGPLIDFAAKGSAVTLAGLDEVGGRKAWHLNVHPAMGGEEDVWLDADTWLELRYDRMADGPAGAQRRVSATYGDYRAVEGLQIPFLIETGGGPGTTPDRMQIERVVLNAPLDDWDFENPAAPRPRHRDRPQASAPKASAAAPGAGRVPR